ncbi:MAG: Nramp family divalent metal transporter [Rhodospirillales bacterium]|jgi:Mn2+/Fe2+ NRAMP family transporter|nr:Nramp family divalent metal transporter [Rhodospirillales bacterium]
MSFASPTPTVTARPGWRLRLLRYLVVAGPGLIVMVADNDAGAVSTYTQAGAEYGTHLLWVLIALLPVTYFVQEMVARLGIATGQGHAAMIYQRFGTWWGRFSLFDLLLVNFLTLVTEFAAIALAAQAAGVAAALAVPLAAAGLVLLVGTGSYRRWERMTLGLCALSFGWFWLALAVHPDWGAALHHTMVPNLPTGGLTGSLVFLIIAIVGTTIAPWQLFFQQSCVADKRLRFADLGAARLDTMIGAVAVVGFAGCMMLVGDALHRAGGQYSDPAHMAGALRPLIGRAGAGLVLVLMANAALLGATAISLSSAWAWGEVMGGRNTLEASMSEAPRFYAAYALCVGAAAALVLIPGAPLQTIILGVQVLAGIMLPSAIVFLQLLLNDTELLGPRFVNRRWNNWVNWTVIGVLFALSLVLAVQVLLPGLSFPAA